MVVQTNLRTYQLGLICNERRPYTRLLRFYYPQEIIRAWKVAEVVAKSAANKDPDLIIVIQNLNQNVALNLSLNLSLTTNVKFFK